jgi:hypothetical protein
MITLEDCKAFSYADPATIALIARQQHLPEVLAIACAHSVVFAASIINVRRPVTPASAAVAVRRLAA